MKVKAYKINAFAKTARGGNPAGIVFDADCLTETNMKKIAEILGLSETAFVMKSDVADFKVRFFTPTEEVDLCGHATVGTFSTMFAKGKIKSGLYKQETKAGILNVEVMEDSSVMMNQTKPKFLEFVDKKEIADSLNISVEDLNNELPIQIVSTGLDDIMVPIKNINILNEIKPNFDEVAKISDRNNAVGYHLFTMDTLNHSTAHCRNLAPLYGIDEESATGTSNGALACYLFKYNQVKASEINQLSFEQGYTMNMPSEILASIEIQDNEITSVKVGGKALNITEVEIEI